MTKLMLHRVRMIFIMVIVIFILLSGRLAYLQIVQHEYYWYRAERNRFTQVTLVAPRGEIYDRQGQLLVTNRPGFIVSLMDMGEGYDRETIAFLSGILGIEEAEIYSAIQGQHYMRYLPLRLKSDITPEIIGQISENRWKLKGVNIEVHPIRDYRTGEAAAHVLGYLSQGEVGPRTQELWAEAGYIYKAGDLVGMEGVERSWEPWLRGRNGAQRIETNHLGQVIDYFERTEPVPGHNLHLTLDLDLQKVAEEALERRIQILKDEGNRFAGRASAVVMDPNSGAILAIANFPSYDLNTFGQDYEILRDDPRRPLTNTAIQGLYPPGSTYKMVTGAAVLEEGLFRERDIYNCPGVITLVPNATRGCFRNIAHGPLNLYDAMAVSCNIYFYRAGLAVGIDRLEQYGREFGLGSPTGLTDLPGEVSGVQAGRDYKATITDDPWYQADTMSVAIGQLYNNFTPLQLANYVSIIANGGTHYRPYLVQSVVDSEKRVVKETEPDAMRQAEISDRTMSVIREAMRRVTQPGGTAWYSFSRLPVVVAAKTGSAQVAAVGSGIPAHSLFVGYAPYGQPEIAVSVIVEHGGIGATGAVPVAAEIMEYYFTGVIEGVMEAEGDDGPPVD